MSEFYHWGIRGMRWGIRRYQNPDGTLTPAGKKRYGEALSKIGSSNEESWRNEGRRRAGISNIDADTDVIKKGSHINRYANSNEALDSRNKYASLTVEDKRRYGEDYDEGALRGATDTPASLFVYSAKKDIRVASGEKVAKDLIDVYGDTAMREMYDYVRKYSDYARNIGFGKQPKAQREAADYVHKASSAVTEFFKNTMSAHMDEISKKYLNEKYDAFVDAEDWAGGYYDYPLVLIEPSKSMKLERKEDWITD